MARFVALGQSEASRVHKQCSIHQLRRYEDIVKNHLKPALGWRKLKDLSQAVRDDLINRNVATGEHPRSSRSRVKRLKLYPQNRSGRSYPPQATLET